MDNEQKNILLKTAKQTITAAVNENKIPHPQSDDPQLNALQGCFVTIKNAQQLRGCIGQFTSKTPLIKLISEMAIASSTRDPRFFDNPITPNELNYLTIEISVLSPLQLTKNPLDLKLGTHGIFIQKGPLSGCFLPQVATETGWSKQQFLENCCSHKAGLNPDAWKNPNTKVYLFTADIFSKDFKDI